MCNDFTMLVTVSDWRYIAQCEHKTVHLRWDHLTVSLPSHAFLQLAEMIHREFAVGGSLFAQVNGLPTRANGNPPSLRLRLNTVLLEFAGADLTDLRNLIEQAIDLLSRGISVTEAPAPRKSLSIQPYPQTTQRSLAHYLN